MLNRKLAVLILSTAAFAATSAFANPGDPFVTESYWKMQERIVSVQASAPSASASQTPYASVDRFNP